MPATAGRVRMPANNRVHSSAALQTHGIWQSAIGYDPYAPDRKDIAGGERAAAASAGGENAYDSFQGLLALARIQSGQVSSADEPRGACKRCKRVGHLSFQCRNFLTVAKDEVGMSVETNKEKGSKLDDHSGTDSDKDSDSDDDSDSDSDVDSEMERAIAKKMSSAAAAKKKKRRYSSEEESDGGESEDERKNKKRRRHSRHHQRSKSSSSSSKKRRKDYTSSSDSEDSSRERRRHRSSKRSSSSKKSSSRKEHSRKRDKDLRKRSSKSRRSRSRSPADELN